jgi:hypothetical protein
MKTQSLANRAVAHSCRKAPAGVTLFRVLLSSVALLGGIAELSAQIDQDHWVPSDRNNSFNSFFGLQQEFTPALNSMDSAQFSIGQGLTGVTSEGGPAVLNIRQGGVDGPIIAASSTVLVPPGFHGDLFFQFIQPVALVPGQVYAMEPFSPTQAPLIFDVNRPPVTPGYAGGRLFYNGQFQGNVDLLFREGIGLVPEPPTLCLLAIAGLGATLAVGKNRR